MHLPLRAALASFAASVALPAFAASAPPPEGIDFSFAYAHTGPGDVNLFPGSVSTNEYTLAHDLDAMTRLGLLQTGFSIVETRIDAPGSIPLPSRLHSVALHFGGVTQIRPGIQPVFRLTPSFDSDKFSLEGDRLNFEAFLGIRHEFPADASLTVGVDARRHANSKWIPVISYKCVPATNWNIDLGFPASSISFKSSDAMEWKLKAEAASHAWRVSRPEPALGNTWLEYRDIKTGLSGTYTTAANFSFAVEAGYAASRRFDYFDRGLQLKPASAAYFAASAVAHF